MRCVVEGVPVSTRWQLPRRVDPTLVSGKPLADGPTSQRRRLSEATRPANGELLAGGWTCLTMTFTIFILSGQWDRRQKRWKRDAQRCDAEGEQATTADWSRSTFTSRHVKPRLARPRSLGLRKRGGGPVT